MWHYCSKDSILKMEKKPKQYRALKYVYNDYKSSYVDLLERVNMPFLFIQRQRVLLIMVVSIFITRSIVIARFIFTARLRKVSS